MEITIKFEEDLVANSHKIEGKDEDALSMYARPFDDACFGWTKDPEYNKRFLLTQQTYFNDLLKAKGHLFLNEVYDGLGMIRTKIGQVCGWVYDESNTIGDNYVDLGIKIIRVNDKINFIIDPNVDGCIIDRI